MHTAKILLIALLIASPALAVEPDPMAAKKQALVKDQKQETIALGGNRFLIFSGTPSATQPGQYGYSLDLVKVTGGVPRFEPLFIEEYDVEDATISFSAGVAFPAGSYRYDKATNTLAYTYKNPDTNASIQDIYKLENDTFTLQQVMRQNPAPATCGTPICPTPPPEFLYKATDDAQTH